MNMTRLKELLPDAPQWFWDCHWCRDSRGRDHVEGWRKWCEGKNWQTEKEKTLWDLCAYFFQHYHFEDHHTQYRSQPPEQFEARQRKRAVQFQATRERRAAARSGA